MYRRSGLVVCGVVAIGVAMLTACSDSATHDGGDGGADGSVDGPGGCPTSDATSIYPTATCTGGTDCMGVGVLCDCVEGKWGHCRLTTCPSSGVGHPYACMTDVQLPPNCSCENVMSPTQMVPYCICNPA